MCYIQTIKMKAVVFDQKNIKNRRLLGHLTNQILNENDLKLFIFNAQL